MSWIGTFVEKLGELRSQEFDKKIAKVSSRSCCDLLGRSMFS